MLKSFRCVLMTSVSVNVHSFIPSQTASYQTDSYTSGLQLILTVSHTHVVFEEVGAGVGLSWCRED